MVVILFIPSSSSGAATTENNHLNFRTPSSSLSTVDQNNNNNYHFSSKNNNLNAFSNTNYIHYPFKTRYVTRVKIFDTHSQVELVSDDLVEPVIKEGESMIFYFSAAQ
jgi:hypothetical protein